MPNAFIDSLNQIISGNCVLTTSVLTAWLYQSERSSRASIDWRNQKLQSEGEDGESIAEKLDIFPPSRSGYTQKVTLAAAPRCKAQPWAVSQEGRQL